MISVTELLSRDMEYILTQAGDELETLAGGHVLLTGGAGFLGYYLVQAIAAWNRQGPAESAIQLDIMDNFSRGRPAWLTAVADDTSISVRKGDITDVFETPARPYDHIIHAAHNRNVP